MGNTLYMKAYKAKYMREWGARKKASGICRYCGSTAARPGRSSCSPCGKKKTAVSVAKIQSKKLKAIQQLGGKCKDCGLVSEFSGIYDFDHLRDKSAGLHGLFRSRGWSRISEELEKCDLVCANCHRIRTIKRTLL